VTATEELAVLEAELAARRAGGSVDSYAIDGNSFQLRRVKELEDRIDLLRDQANAESGSSPFKLARLRPR
jgi:hypothetical protein